MSEAEINQAIAEWNALVDRIEVESRCERYEATRQAAKRNPALRERYESAWNERHGRGRR